MSQADRESPWIIVDGASDAGRALAARLSSKFVVPIVHQPSGLPREIAIDAYDQLPPSLSLAGATIVNCAGTAQGSAGELQHANCAVPMAWATESAKQGAIRFVQVSSFSVFGVAPSIDKTTHPAPTREYGRSKLAAEQALASCGLADRLTILRVPILVGGGRDKLAQLVAIARRVGVIPAAPYPTPRSMLSYDGLAATIEQAVRRGWSGVFHAADPQPFTPELLEQRSSAIGIRARKMRVPGAALALLRRTAPGIHTSLFQPSLLDDRENSVPAELEFERIEAVIDRLLAA